MYDIYYMENKEEIYEPISQKQLVLIDKLLQTSKLTKTERDYIVDKTRGRLKTTYDGKILIEMLLAKIRFEKHFNGNKVYKKARCFWCKNKVGLQRWEGNRLKDRIWVCGCCESRALDLGYSPVIWNKMFGNDPNEKMKLNVAPDEDPHGERQEEFCN